MTFVYTRCPLADYCFRLTNHLGALQRRFQRRLGRELVLLTISFDPLHDQVEVLADHARTWKADPDAWRFLTGREPEVKQVCARFGIGVWPDESRLTHSLRTAVVDRQGRLAATLEGNDFTSQQLGDLVEAVLRPGLLRPTR